MSIAFTRYFKELSAIIWAARGLLDATAAPLEKDYRATLDAAEKRCREQGPLRVALIGEFNAGKSSLIAALTGEDVKIDADVCTGVATAYMWEGLTLVDTPGIQAGGQATDHDLIAREATTDADLILFVVTNELFNPRLAAHLRYILDDSGLGLAKKTALIVNKIDRESNGEHPLLEEIHKVLGPHCEVPIYFCAASKFIQSQSEPELRARFIRQSRLDELTAGIDQFVDDAQAFGRLATPLLMVADMLDAAQSALVATDGERKRLELIRRQKVILQDLQRRMLDVRKTWKQAAYSTVLGQSEAAVVQIDENTTGVHLEELFKSGMVQAAAKVGSLYDGAQSDLAEVLEAAQSKLDQLGEGALALNVESETAARAKAVAVSFKDEKPNDLRLAADLAKLAGKPLRAGLDAASKNAKGLRDLVYTAGKKIGHKFRPYEAVKAGEKIASVAGKLSKAAPFLAVAFDLVVQYREEKVKLDKERYLANLRLALRRTFADQARVEAEALEVGIVKVSQGPVADSLTQLDRMADAIAEGEGKMQILASGITALRERCTLLKNGLMNGAAQESEQR